MARIARKTQLVFGGSLAAASNIAKFGSLRVGVPDFSLDPALIQTTEYLNGWAAALTANKSPALQDLNALHYLHSLQTAYLMQQGIAEWDAATPYFIGSTVVAADNTGKQYIAIADNTGVAVSDLTKWKPHGPSIPLGAVIATFPYLGAAAYQCSATTVADVEGFVKCNGQTIADATSPMNGYAIPNINNDVFLMGNTTSGTASVTGNTRDLSHVHAVSGSLPAHIHGLDSTGGAKIFAAPGGGLLWASTAGPSFTADYVMSTAGGTGGQSLARYATVLTGNTSNISNSDPVSLAADSRLSATQDIRPKYITAVYLMRIK